MDTSDTIEFDIDEIPYPFKHLPRHYDMVELMTPEELRLAHNERSRKYYAANRASLVAASFAEFRQKNVFRKPLQCGCGEQYERFAEYQKHINQCKHRHFGIRKAKDVSLETPGVSKLSCLRKYPFKELIIQAIPIHKIYTDIKTIFLAPEIGSFL